MVGEKSTPESESISIALTEAKRTMDRQAEMFDDIQKKAIMLMKYTVTLASVLATGITILTSTDTMHSYGTLVNPYTLTCILLFGLAAIISGFAYTLSTQINGANRDTIRAAKQTDHEEYKRCLIEAYASWIQQNHQLNQRADALVSLAILSIAAALIALATGLISIFYITPPWWIAAIDTGVVLGLAYLSGTSHRLHQIVTQYDSGSLNPVSNGRDAGSFPSIANSPRTRTESLDDTDR